jgi:hypothetical protein
MLCMHTPRWINKGSMSSTGASAIDSMRLSCQLLPFLVPWIGMPPNPRNKPHSDIGEAFVFATTRLRQYL